MRPRTDKIATPDRQAELFDLLGTTLGAKYRLERLLGAGGMGGVYAAKPLAGGDAVAIKVLSVADPAARERIAKRFAREARAVSALNSPHIVTVFDAGTEGDRPWLAMELLEGEDLGQRIRRESHLSVRDAVHLAAQILVALGSAHEQGIVHRDLKPDNVFITPRPDDPLHCKLLDFGMSKLLAVDGQTLALALTKKGMAVGTPFYMAPEQARAMDDVDGRVDLWALGAILFECLAGRPPFIGPTQEQVLIALCTTDAPDVRALRPGVPSPVAKLIKRALIRDRKDRFGSVAEMLAALVEACPEEAKLLPAKPWTTTADMPAVSTERPNATSSGPFNTLPLAPLPIAVTAAVAEAKPVRSKPAPAPKKRASSRMLPVLILGFCALVLGIGVTVYVLAMTRAH